MAYQNNYASRIISSENITSTGTSAQSSAAPFGAKLVRIATTANVNIVIGLNPTATAASTLIEPAAPGIFVINPSTTVGGSDGEKIASIGTATVNITFMEG